MFNALASWLLDLIDKINSQPAPMPEIWWMGVYCWLGIAFVHLAWEDHQSEQSDFEELMEMADYVEHREYQLTNQLNQGLEYDYDYALLHRWWFPFVVRGAWWGALAMGISLFGFTRLTIVSRPWLPSWLAWTLIVIGVTLAIVSVVGFTIAHTVRARKLYKLRRKYGWPKRREHEPLVYKFPKS